MHAPMEPSAGSTKTLERPETWALGKKPPKPGVQGNMHAVLFCSVQERDCDLRGQSAPRVLLWSLSDVHRTLLNITDTELYTACCALFSRLDNNTIQCILLYCPFCDSNYLCNLLKSGTTPYPRGASASVAWYCQ
jgi:hypothetical protein